MCKNAFLSIKYEVSSECNIFVQISGIIKINFIKLNFRIKSSITQISVKIICALSTKAKVLCILFI
jgi:hypothetical protein